MAGFICYRSGIDRRSVGLFIRNLSLCSRLLAEKKSPEKPTAFDDNPSKQYTSNWQSPYKGKIYDKKPFKVHCEKGKAYNWCACGLSKSQPFCDGSHNGPLMRSILRPVLFIAPEDKDYWFCNCKRTSHRPLCDGTHKNPDIQAAIKY
ncbi:hypothetical protein CHUAL_007175 [Chamberlinius hualienensis]